LNLCCVSKETHKSVKRDPQKCPNGPTVGSADSFDTIESLFTVQELGLGFRVSAA